MLVVVSGYFSFLLVLFFFFFFKQKTAYEMQRGLVGSEMCIRDRVSTQSTWDGLIENKTLFSILEERAKSPDTPEELKKAFLQLADEEGKLLKEELRYHMCTMGEPMEEKDVKKFLEAGKDAKDDRYFNIDQFVEAVFKKKNAKK
eukprot:TRINITY_DN11472_c0_g1_i3.p1 TRINITY_DN11472_c0_g1~~TRINITY_DN11472_c0_g1_i3.p1  ORF type:complete len:145 (-),score=61.57 TRINITY_DN11472_c0_g1_i3:137-571(-)